MVEMKDTKLPAIDLNLLLVLHTVLSEESATGAARKLNVTQSAVSNGLARLREVFDDPLFVRTGRGLVPTPRAEALRPMLASAIELLERTTEGENFDPKRTTREFSLACGDNHYLFELRESSSRSTPGCPKRGSGWSPWNTPLLRKDSPPIWRLRSDLPKRQRPAFISSLSSRRAPPWSRGRKIEKSATGSRSISSTPSPTSTYTSPSVGPARGIA